MSDVPPAVAAFAAGAFMHGPSSGSPDDDWQRVAAALAKLGCEYHHWEDLRAAAAAWAVTSLAPEILLSRRWY